MARVGGSRREGIGSVAAIEHQIAALEEAISSGVLEVTIKSGESEKRVKYHSMANLIEAKRLLERKLNRQRPNVTLAALTRG
jgi:hypothetical protein